MNTRQLFDLGAELLMSSAARSRRPPTKALLFDAVRHQLSVAEIRTAIDFAKAVNVIHDQVDHTANEILLSGDHPLVTPMMVVQLAKCSSGRVRSALDRIVRGLHPFAAEPPSGRSINASRWLHDLGRLHQIRSLLASAACHVHRLSAIERRDIFHDAVAIKLGAQGLLLRLEEEVGTARSGERDDLLAVPRSDIRRIIARARSQFIGVAHDVPLMKTRFALPSDICREMIGVTRTAHSIASEIAECLKIANQMNSNATPVVEAKSGPGNEGGTYVYVFHLHRAAVLRIGRLETFWFPAGYFAYVGSAINGVKHRTDRHRDPNAPKKWNIDHLKDAATPVELWWSESMDKLECHWAMNLAMMSQFSCPALGFGSNDCKTCPAHLFHSAQRPSIRSFAASVGAIDDHPPIRRVRFCR